MKAMFMEKHSPEQANESNVCKHWSPDENNVFIPVLNSQSNAFGNTTTTYVKRQRLKKQNEDDGKQALRQREKAKTNSKTTKGRLDDKEKKRQDEDER